MNEVRCICLDSSGEDGRDEFQVGVRKGDGTPVGYVGRVLIFLMN